MDRKEYLLGENVLLHLVLENGEMPFEIDCGGNYRDSNARALRFHVTATDSEGRVAEDPDLTQMNMGGMGGRTR